MPVKSEYLLFKHGLKQGDFIEISLSPTNKPDSYYFNAIESRLEHIGKNGARETIELTQFGYTNMLNTIFLKRMKLQSLSSFLYPKENLINYRAPRELIYESSPMSIFKPTHKNDQGITKTDNSPQSVTQIDDTSHKLTSLI